MLPYTLIDPNAAFSKAFITVGMHWAAYVVAVGALLGIVTGARQGNQPSQQETTEIACPLSIGLIRLAARS